MALVYPYNALQKLLSGIICSRNIRNSLCTAVAFQTILVKKMSKSTVSEGQLANIGNLRKPYKDNLDAFTEESLDVKEPFALFEKWFKLACNTEGIKEANAMALATADKLGRPSVRYLLLKGYGKDGFCFFTNHNSRKGKELAENPYATLLFYWEQLSRQIRIEGPVERASEHDSELYFHSRPKSSQIAALVSQQSAVIENRKVLTEKHEKLEKEYSDAAKIIPKPDYWGGYRVIPKTFEFWQGQTNRLHDRIRFRQLNPGETVNPKVTSVGDNGWVYERLSP